MRVLHIGKYFPPFAGGMEQFLADLLPALRAREIEPAALVHGHAGHNGRIDDHRGCPIYRAPSHGRLLFAPVSPAFPRWLERAIRDWRPQLLHLHLPNTSAFWVMASPAARRLPWLVHWHADVTDTDHAGLRLGYAFYRPLEQRLLRRSRGIVATSPAYLDSSRALAAHRELCRVVPLGVDPGRLPVPDTAARAQATTLWPASGCRILALGRLTYYKGFDVLLHAAAMVPELQLVIVGGGEQHKRLAALIERLGLQSRVRLAGFQPDPVRNALLAGCDLLCLPSLTRAEAFGVVLLEAMRFGKPVVASDIPGSGVGWVVRQGGHGRLTPPGDSIALAETLRMLTGDRALRENLGRFGQQALRERFAISPVARQFAALYRSLDEPAEAARTAPPGSGAGTGD